MLDPAERDLAAILREAGIAVAYLFGSRASATHRSDSDADVAVLTERPLGLLEREALARRLAAVLEVPAVDLVVLDDAGLQLRGGVVQEGRPIFSADEPRRVAFEVRTRSEYLDFLPTLREHTRSYLSRVAKRGF